MYQMLPSQPSSYGQLIKLSLRLYQASFLKICLVSLTLAIIVFIPRLISDFIGHDLFVGLPLISPYRLWLILLSIIELFFFIAIIWHMYCVATNVREPFIQDFRVGIKKVAYVFLAIVLENAIFILSVLLIFNMHIFLHKYHLLPTAGPGFIYTCILLAAESLLIIYISTLFIFLVPLIAIENKTIVGSLERSVFLSWNHWWRIFSTQVTPWITYLLVLYVLRYLLKVDIHIYLSDHAQHPLWTTIVNIALFAIFIPWVAALLLVQLKDIEVRKKIRL